MRLLFVSLLQYKFLQIHNILLCNKLIIFNVTICFLCNMSICNFVCSPILFKGQDLGFDCTSSCSLLTLVSLKQIEGRSNLKCFHLILAVHLLPIINMSDNEL